MSLLCLVVDIHHYFSSDRCSHPKPKLPPNLSATTLIFHTHYKTCRITPSLSVLSLSLLIHITLPSTPVHLPLPDRCIPALLYLQVLLTYAPSEFRLFTTIQGKVFRPPHLNFPHLLAHTCSRYTPTAYSCWLHTPSVLPITTPPANQLILPLHFIIKQFTNESSLLLRWTNRACNFCT